MPDRKFIIGNAEHLTEVKERKFTGGEKTMPYTLKESIQKLSEQMTSTLTEFESLPDEACSKQRVCAKITMHPRFISKSSFPDKFFDFANFRCIGNTTIECEPEKWGIDRSDESITTVYYVVSKKESFKQITNIFNSHPSKIPGTQNLEEQLMSIEQLTAFTAEDRIKPGFEKSGTEKTEIVLHHYDREQSTINDLISFAGKCDIDIDQERARSYGALYFFPTTGEFKNLKKFSDFTLLRTVRPMPKIRPTPDFLRGAKSLEPNIPDRSEDDLVKVAVFDAGLPDNHRVEQWVNHITFPNREEPLPNGKDHGLGVTSAALFGSLDKKDVKEPDIEVDHYQTIWKGEDYDIYDALSFVEEVLSNPNRDFEFANFSLGPAKPIEDGDIDAWTAALDYYASNGDLFITVAVGNEGQKNDLDEQNRIQPPSDGVNVLGVGATDRKDGDWDRADYSCVGPGRSPGLIKPDGVTFGGAQDNPFYVLDASNNGKTVGTYGTSFSAPVVLRAAAGIRKRLGHALSLNSIRALMLHRADKKDRSKDEVGWGKFCVEPDTLIECEEDEVHILYQGKLAPRSYNLRMPIPIPEEGLEGKVTLSATYCISCYIDPAHPMNYTKNGLEVVLRPDYEDEDSGTKSFFSTGNMYESEWDLRRKAHKWESCASYSRNFYGSTLINPCFDIYCHSRDRSKDPEDPTSEDIDYAFFVTLRSKKTPDLHNKVLQRSSSLEELVPIRQRVRSQS